MNQIKPETEEDQKPVRRSNLKKLYSSNPSRPRNLKLYQRVPKSKNLVSLNRKLKKSIKLERKKTT